MIDTICVSIDRTKINACLNKRIGDEVIIMGKIISKFSLGKAVYCELEDETGSIQIYFNGYNKDGNILSPFVEGDVIAVRGVLSTTARNHLQVTVDKVIVSVIHEEVQSHEFI